MMRMSLSQQDAITPFRSKSILFVERISWRFIDRLIVVSDAIGKWYKQHLGEKRTQTI